VDSYPADPADEPSSLEAYPNIMQSSTQPFILPRSINE